MRRYLLACCIPALGLAGCSSVDSNYVAVPTQESILVKARQFPWVPVPRGLELIAARNESGSFEAGSFKWARLHYRGTTLLPAAVAFVKDQLAQMDWELIREERPGEREQFLKLARERYQVEVSFKQVGENLLMDVLVNTRHTQS
jgi:hypothetical protein